MLDKPRVPSVPGARVDSSAVIFPERRRPRGFYLAPANESPKDPPGQGRIRPSRQAVSARSNETPAARAAAQEQARRLAKRAWIAANPRPGPWHALRGDTAMNARLAVSNAAVVADMTQGRMCSFKARMSAMGGAVLCRSQVCRTGAVVGKMPSNLASRADTFFSSVLIPPAGNEPAPDEKSAYKVHCGVSATRVK